MGQAQLERRQGAVHVDEEGVVNTCMAVLVRSKQGPWPPCSSLPAR